MMGGNKQFKPPETGLEPVGYERTGQLAVNNPFGGTLMGAPLSMGLNRPGVVHVSLDGYHLVFVVELFNPWRRTELRVKLQALRSVGLQAIHTIEANLTPGGTTLVPGVEIKLETVGKAVRLWFPLNEIPTVDEKFGKNELTCYSVVVL